MATTRPSHGPCSGRVPRFGAARLLSVLQMALALYVGGMLGWFFRPAEAAVSPLRIGGSFMQYQTGMLSWSPSDWGAVLDSFREAGMDTVIIQMLASENSNGTVRSWIVSNGGADPTEAILNYADAHGLRVVLGLYMPQFGSDMTGEAFLGRASDRCNTVLREVSARYFTPAAHSSFGGWYVPLETWTAAYDSNQVARLRGFYRGIADACRSVSGPATVAISPFISAERPAPCEVERVYGDLLRGSGVDVVMLQDSVGAQQWRDGVMERTSPWYEAFGRACAAGGARLWANVESFEIRGGAFTSCPVERLSAQIDAAGPLVDRIVTFDFLNYMNPVRFIQGWDVQKRAAMTRLYSEYKAAFVDVARDPYVAPVLMWAHASEGLELSWRADGGSVCRLESAAQLVEGAWSGSDLPVGTNGAARVVKVGALGGEARRYYRLVKERVAHVPDTMAWIQPGSFSMGTPLSDPEFTGNELRPATVVHSAGFWIGRFELAQWEYQNLMCTNPAAFRGDPERPAEMVSWNDAVLYCSRLTQREAAAGRLPSGYAYRLPTEAEWEYAARAGTTARYGFGDTSDGLAGHGWYDADSAGVPHPRGLLESNAWGLCDTAGNVFEWCYDWLSAPPKAPGRDPRGAITGSYRAIRGGAWSFPAADCRPSWRLGYAPGGRFWDVGFRVVLSPIPP